MRSSKAAGMAAVVALALATAPVTFAVAEEEAYHDASEATRATLAQKVDTESAPWWRLSGANRYATMAKIVERTASRSNRAVIASGENFADALAASSLAGALGCPVVTSAAGALPAETKEALERFGVDEAYVVGGPQAISDGVVGALRASGIEVKRVFGENRQQTSVEVGRQARTADGSSRTVIVASGTNFADALSVGPYAYATTSPILLTSANGTLSDPEIESVWESGATRVVIVGGESSVSEFVRQQLTLGNRSYEFVRLGGENRYETSARIAEWECANGLDWAYPSVASGANFPDALAGASLAGTMRSPVLLAHDRADASMAVLRAHDDAFQGGFLLGGPASVSWSFAVDVDDAPQNSPLVSYVNLSPNHSGPRTSPITRITPHYMDFDGSVEECGELFARPSREASSNYGIGVDGRIGLYVEEANRSWCSSSSDNDNRAITIECASLSDSSLTQATWDSLVDLCVDICHRNGIDRLVYTGDTTGNLTMHKWFAVNPPTVCPGPWLSARFETLARTVNERL